MYIFVLFEKNNYIFEFRKTPIVGITSLGFDHTTVLGNTLEEIAWQKSGIMKPNCVAIISNNQPKETLKILIDRSIEKQASEIIYYII